MEMFHEGRSHMQLLDQVRGLGIHTGLGLVEVFGGLPFPSPGDLPDSGIKPMTLALAGGFFTTGPSGKPTCSFTLFLNQGLL